MTRARAAIGRLAVGVALLSFASGVAAPVVASPREKPRLFVLTDVSAAPGDEESLVRLLVYANEFDVEGLVATTSVRLKTAVHPEVIEKLVGAYGLVRDNLAVHAPGFPAAETLRSVIKAGNPGYGLAAVGDGKTSDGARLLVEAVDWPDPRPLWVAVWGGANTLAQALYDVRKTRARRSIDDFVARLRVYAISDQDDAGAWLRKSFKNLTYVVSPTAVGGGEDHRATWTGISGDRHHRNGPMVDFDLVDEPWLVANVIENHGPLGALYPKPADMMEPDTPSFLNLVGNGLAAEADPGRGGWGGRYENRLTHGEARPIFTSARDTVTVGNGAKAFRYTSEQATIWRWRRAFQHDFAARMDWCMTPERARANHNPVVIVNGADGLAPVELAATAGTKVALSAAGSRDPDGNPLVYRWFVYPEAGTLPPETAGTVILAGANRRDVSLLAPAVTAPGTLHVILEVEDGGKPSLFSYRRVIVTVAP